MQGGSPAKAFMFKSIFHVAKGKKHTCKWVHNIRPWLLAQLALQRINQQSNNPSALPHAMKFLSSISCASLPRLGIDGRAKQLL